jgi:hypothetical protein
MNKTSQGNSNIVPRVQELADLVDKLYSRPRYWTSIISIGGFAFLTTIVVIILGQIVIIGSQTDGLSIGDTVTSTIALVALVISISQYIGNTDSVENNEWVADCIKHNQKKIGKQQPNLSMDDKLILSGLIKLKTRNESAPIRNVIDWLGAYTPLEWIALLYELGDGSSLLRK